MYIKLLIFCLAASVGCFFYTEIILILSIAAFGATDQISNLIVLSSVRLVSSLLVVFLMAALSIRLAHNRRVIAMREDWMRNDQVAELLPSFLLTVFEQLIAFYYLARLRIFIDSLFVITFVALLIQQIDTTMLILAGFGGFICLLLGVLLYVVFSAISHKTTSTENALVECAKLVNQRGSHGWRYDDVKSLIDHFSLLSAKLNSFLTIRYSISGALRVTIEFTVFILVALGILVTKGKDINADAEAEVIMLLVFSRLAPILFSIFSQVSTLGFGDSAKRVYFHNR